MKNKVIISQGEEDVYPKIFIDGVEVNRMTSFSIGQSVDTVTKVTIEFWANVNGEVYAETDLNEKKIVIEKC